MCYRYDDRRHEAAFLWRSVLALAGVIVVALIATLVVTAGVLHG